MSHQANQSETVLLQKAAGVATILLNRPEVRNAIDDEMRADLVSALAEVASDTSVRALIITGAGAGFCSGGDIKGMKERLEAPATEIGINGWRRQQRVHHSMLALYDLPKPTIAAVNGPANGLGCDLALCCDFVLASSQASFTMSYISRGLIPDGGGMYFLPRRVGLSKAKELIYSGRRVGADEALVLGIADRIAPDEGLMQEAQAWARELSGRSPTALALAKTILNQSSELSAPQVFAMGSQGQAICYASGEHKAAVAAFLERNSTRKADRP